RQLVSTMNWKPKIARDTAMQLPPRRNMSMASCTKQIVYHLGSVVRKPSSIYFNRRGSRLLEDSKYVQLWQCQSMSSHNSEKGGDDEVDSSKSKEKQQTKDSSNSNKKLNNLIQSIMQNKDSKKSEERVKLSVPLKVKDPEARMKKSKKIETDVTGEVKLGKRVRAAVKKVAESVGGDAVQVENELLNKLKSSNTPKAKLSDIFEGMAVESLTSSAKDPDQVDRLRQMETSRAARVHHLMEDKPIERSTEFREPGEGRRSRQNTRGQFQGRSDQPEYFKVDLFGARPLGIFERVHKPKQPVEQESSLKTWDYLYQKQLKMLVTHPPANGFEEMILWTEQKKLWHFPIDNEQGLTEEAKYTFEDHVFLDNQIESWCPPKGPIRNFMELVCTGLAKNSYLTVPEKREYLTWYHEYFKSKSAVLKQTGAGEVN
ncbi:unnamed protein product, partial [Allacma fusca]